MKTPKCKNCGKEGVYTTFCFCTKHKPIPAKGKVAIKWEQTRTEWFEEHNDEYFECYLCLRPVHRDVAVLDHLVPRSNARKGVALRFNFDNLRAVHGWCNNDKGSRSLEALGIVL